MERLGVAWKPEFEKPFPYLKPMVSCIASHQDNVLLIEGGNSRGRVNRDWFDERAPREDGLTDEADLDVTMLMLRDVRMGLLVSQRASLVKENVIACLQIVDDVRDHAHTITDQEHCHSEAFLILGFAYEIPFRLLLIFHPDSRSSLDRISASVKYLETMHSEIDKQDFKSLETGRKQSLWLSLSQAGEVIEQAYFTVKEIVARVDLFEVKKHAQMDHIMLDKIVESGMKSAQKNTSHQQNQIHLFELCYSHLARFNRALQEVVDGLLYYGALFKRAHRSIEIWKLLICYDDLDISLLTDWLAYWIEVLIVSTQAFGSLEAHFEKLEQSDVVTRP
ncbi:hypothetical protein PCANC_19769 [Puccinia coronata f. sp. avenae]|uniref:Uncharacterized protein n=1 Tax=Puccinia coronata f. sp. avenae TaxID=200324 RepID=A0A2N5UB59_9BASI|nr:hypothetical protein PCANC_19769 [Puccinia coronata f. sp. avenae]